MKAYIRSSTVLLFMLVLLAAGCSRPEPASSPQQPSVQPAPAPAAPPGAAPAPAPPAETRKTEQPKPAPAPKPRAAAPRPAPAAEQPQPAPVAPEVKTAPKAAETAPVPPAPKVLRETVMLPAGTLVPVRTSDSVDSRTDKVGQTFHAAVDEDVLLDGRTVITKGADARLKLIQVSSAGEIRGKSELRLRLDQIVIGKTTYNVASDVVERAAAAEGPKTARDIAIGGAIGAVIGAVTGGKKGAAIGAGAGAGGGAVVAAITKGEQVLVPSETRLEFRLEEPIAIEIEKKISD